AFLCTTSSTRSTRLSYIARSFSTFFFSSRRRHTIFDCDWSSDVCSSDLGSEEHRIGFGDLPGGQDEHSARFSEQRAGGAGPEVRSEERRVGKECRNGRAPVAYKKTYK